VGAALRIATAQGVRSARLPIDDIVRVRKTSLTCLAVVQILAGYARTGDWVQAVQEAPAMNSAPLRKYVVWKHGRGPARSPAADDLANGALPCETQEAGER